MRLTEGFLVGLAIVVVTLGIWSLFAWGVSFLIAYVTGYDLGFLRTAGAMILISVLSGLLFGKLKGSVD